MLNNMAGPDLPAALDRHVQLGLRLVDLKDAIWGRKVEELDDEQAARAAGLIQERGLAVHCLSSALGWTDINIGETAWRDGQEKLLDNVLRVARTLQPRYVRVLAVRAGAVEQSERWSFHEASAAHPWFPAAYAALVRRIVDAGFLACVENEARHCVLGTPEDVVDFFSALRPLLKGAACDYIWDVQNMWQMGTFPTLAVYEKLAPGLRLLHLKGGQADGLGRLAEASTLRTASWPVRSILLAVHRAGTVDVICLNPSHGRRPSSYDIWGAVQDDIAFLRETFLSFSSAKTSPAS